MCNAEMANSIPRRAVVRNENHVKARPIKPLTSQPLNFINVYNVLFTVQQDGYPAAN